MPPSFATASCSSCGKQYRLPCELAGRYAKCRGCGATLRIEPGGRSFDEQILDWLTAPDQPRFTRPRVEGPAPAFSTTPRSR